VKITISVSASEKLSPAQFESLERSVFISAEIDPEIDGIQDGESIDELIARMTKGLQLRAEAQMYSALARGMADRGQSPRFLRAAALDRAERIAKAQAIPEQCDPTPQPAQKGVLS
jgi:hypothetical protein